MKYYLFGGMSAAFLLLGFSYLYGLSGSTYLPRVVYGVNNAAFNGGGPLLLIALVMIAAGLGFKIAAVPFHFWAPDTYEGAPAPAAAFIASVSKVASYALLISIGNAALKYLQIMLRNLRRFRPCPSHHRRLNRSDRWFAPLCGQRVLQLAADSSCALSRLHDLRHPGRAVRKASVRRLLAYSTIAHAGYVLLGLAFLDWTNRIPQAVLYYILTYGLTTIGAFGVVGVVERAAGSDKFDAFLGLHKRSPVLAAVLLVVFLSLAGIPPLVGFWAKFNLFAAVLGVSAGVVPFSLVALAVALSAVSLYYYLQVLKRVYVMPAVDETPIAAHPVTLVVLVLDCRRGCRHGLLPGAAAGLDRELLSGDIIDPCIRNAPHAGNG